MHRARHNNNSAANEVNEALPVRVTMGLFFPRRSRALQAACAISSVSGSGGFGATPLHSFMLRVLGNDCSTLMRHQWGDIDFEFKCK